MRPHKSLGDLSGVFSVGCVVTRKSPVVHLQSIFILSDLALNAYVSATKVATKNKEEL